MSEARETSETTNPEPPSSASRLLPLVYEELRGLAKAQMARENPNHTLQGTALVHEAYLRLTRPGEERRWNGQAHFCAAVTEVMRRILVDSARRKKRLKRGGDLTRQGLDADALQAAEADGSILALDEALTELAGHNPNWAELVKLRYFMGLTVPDAARILDVSPRTADSWWAGARAWLRQKLALDIGEGLP
jgi:RNA polymerase sigma factor (TIGR02999 family)